MRSASLANDQRAGNAEEDVVRRKHEQGSQQGRAEEAKIHVKQAAGKAFGNRAMEQKGRARKAGEKGPGEIR